MDIKKTKLNLSLNIDLENLGKKFEKVPKFLDKKRKMIITLIVICLLGYCFYEYYRYIYRPIWSEQEKQNYINTKEKDAIFNEQDFQVVIGELEKRKVEFIDNPGKISKDIFKVNQ